MFKFTLYLLFIIVIEYIAEYNYCSCCVFKCYVAMKIAA